MFFFLPSACSKRDPQQLPLGDAPKFGRQKLIRYSENRCVFLSGTPIWGAVVHLGVVISWSCPVINIRCFFLFAGHRKRIAHNLDLPPVARITRNPILQVGDPVLNFHLPWLHPGGEIQGMMSCWVTWPFLLGLIRHLIKGNQWFSSALIIIRPAISRGGRLTSHVGILLTLFGMSSRSWHVFLFLIGTSIKDTNCILP